MFQAVKHITLWSSLKALGYRLWDEERKKLVGFSYVSVYLGKKMVPVPVSARFGQDAESQAHGVRSHR
jgi:hypothetical protein